MSDAGLSRRAFMAAAAGASGALMVASWPETAEAAERAMQRAERTGRARYKALKQEDAADIIALTSQIIPSDDTPGAKEAGVVFFVDQALAKQPKELKEPVQQLLTRINDEGAKRFPGKGRVAALGDAEQHALVEWVEKSHPDSFGFLKGMTVTGMFAMPSRGGNRNKAGWKLIGFKDQFSWEAPYGWYDGEGAK